MSAHAVFITHRTKSGQRSKAEAVWNRIMKPAIIANPNHLAYVYTLPDEEPDVIRAFQLYRTADDAAAFLQTPEYLQYTEAVDEHLDGPPHVASTPAAWVKP
ncbi:MAG: antibiotic biosynthesis monooxygenase [Ilumatobacter sp.]|uniref:putative quinol monooxygenase n=1 Tax=Ilumatobacter sp. TaxID=1967498 RepID=UPI003C70A2F3